MMIVPQEKRIKYIKPKSFWHGTARHGAARRNAAQRGANY